MWSGPQFENVDVDVDEALDSGLASVSSAHPSILSMNSTACRASRASPYQLLDCPVTAAFDVDVWLDYYSVLIEDTALLLDSLQSLDCNISEAGRPNCPLELEVCVLRALPRLPAVRSALLARRRHHRRPGPVRGAEQPVLRELRCRQPQRLRGRPARQRQQPVHRLPARPVHRQRQQPGGLHGLSARQLQRGLGLCSVPSLPRRHVHRQGGRQLVLGLQPEQLAALPGPGALRRVRPGQLHPLRRQPQMARTAASCLPCPFRARCSANGSIEADSGAYLLLEQDSAEVRSVPCSPTACVGLEAAQRGSSAAELLQTSQLPVLNWCGLNREPALSASGRRTQRAVRRLHPAAQPGQRRVRAVRGGCLGLAAAVRAAAGAAGARPAPRAARLERQRRAEHRRLLPAAQPRLPRLAVDAAHPWPRQPQPARLAPALRGASRLERSTGRHRSVVLHAAAMDDYGRMALQLASPALALAALALVYGIQQLARWLLSQHRVAPGTAAVRLAVRVRRDGRLVRPRQLAAVPLLNGASGVAQPVSGAPFLYQRTLVRVALLAYSSLALTSLSFFRLQDVGVFGWRVADYPQMAPSDAAYRAMMPLVLLLLLTVVCGLPLALLALLLFHHRAGLLSEQSDDSAVLRRQYLTQPVGSSALVQQLVCMYRSRGVVVGGGGAATAAAAGGRGAGAGAQQRGVERG